MLGEFGHDVFWIEIAGEYMFMVAVFGDDLVIIFQVGLYVGDDCFLADIEVAEAGNFAYAVELAGFLFEVPDQ